MAALVRHAGADVPARSGGTHRRQGRRQGLRPAGWRCEGKIMFDVAPTAFVPQPKVTSSVVRLIPRLEPLPCDSAVLQRMTEAAFGQRRKMLRQRLKSLGVDTGALLAQAGIAPTARAEEIPVEGFVALANVFSALAKN